MVAIALAAIATTAIVAIAFTSILRSLTRQYARERDLLINQMCSLAGNPWQPPPAKDEPVQVLATADDFVFSPEHDPEY